MNQTALEIENAVSTWVVQGQVLDTWNYEGLKSDWTHDVNDYTGLVYYLEEYAPFNSQGERHVVIPGIEGEMVLHEMKGGEGQGDYAHAVVEIRDGWTVRYFKFSGYHRSHDGTYYDSGFTEVRPFQKLVDDWEDV